MTELMSITEVAEASGLQSSALRYYERAGLIRPEARIGGRRHYDPSVVRRLRVIGLLQDVGFTIGEIAQLLSRSDRRQAWRALAEGKLTQIDEHLERVNNARDLLTAALACGCSSLDTCDVVQRRPGRHGRVVQALMPKMGAPS